MAKQTTPATPSGTTARPKAPSARPAGEAVSRRLNPPSLLTFFQESRAELRKVTWPTRQEVINLTAAVVAMTVGLSIFLGLVDTVLQYIIKPLIGQ